MPTCPGPMTHDRSLLKFARKFTYLTKNTVEIMLKHFSYDVVLTRMVAKFDDRSIDRLRAIFGWIAYAKRPLKVYELRSAIVYGTGKTMIEELVPSYVFEMCAPLVEERKDHTLSFVHVSVKEYTFTGFSHKCSKLMRTTGTLSLRRAGFAST
jgi:hypothetical protein